MKNYEKIYEEENYALLTQKNDLYFKENPDSNSVRAKTRPKIPCSVKPISCVIPRDLNLKEIFIQLSNSSFLLSGNNKIYLKLSQEQVIKRKNIIESIKKFIIINRIKYKIFYNIIYMLDILICYNNKNKLFSNIEKLGLGSAILMIKFAYEEYRMIPLNKFKYLYEKKYYTLSQLQEIEIGCLKLVDYYMNFPTPLSFMELLLLNGIIFSTDNIKNETSQKIYNLMFTTLEKIILMSNEYVKYNPLHLCCCIAAYCRESYKIEKWPKILSKVFDVTQKHFDHIYKEFFSIYSHHHSVKSSININISDKLIDRNFSSNEFIKNLREKNELKINNYEECKEDCLNKDKIINKENNEIKAINMNNNEDNKNLKFNNNTLNIRVNFKTSQEIRNSALFRKMNYKFNKSYKNKNLSGISNLNNVFNLKNDVINTIFNEEHKNNYCNYGLNTYKPNNSIKKPLINIYKTPIKFDNDNNISCFYKPNKKSIVYNLHQRNISNITISIKNNNMFECPEDNQILFSRGVNTNKCDESNINNNIINNTNYANNINNNRDINKYTKKLNNKTIGEIHSKMNEIDEIKVKVKDFTNNNNSLNKEKYKKKISFFNKFIPTESDLQTTNKNDLNEINKNDKIIKNNDSCITIIEPYKNNLLWKNPKNPIKINDNSNNNNNNIVNKTSKREFNYLNGIKTTIDTTKKISINRHSSYNEKYKTKENYGQNKEEDNSNETTSENSHNFSIRRNYFKLKRLRDKSININNDNTTLTNNKNITNESNTYNKSISVIKCDLNNNGIKTTKFKECLRIGLGSSMERRVYTKNNENEIEKEKEKENNKSINHVKRYSEIRNFYKLKNFNKKYIGIAEKNKERTNNISRNFMLQ